MNSIHSNLLTSVGIAAVVIVAGAAVIYASDGYTANQATTVSITGPDGVCKKVTNNSATGLSEYIPTASVAEWQSFVANPPAGVMVGACPTLQINSWVNLGTVLPGPLANSQSAVIGGYVYLFGGRTSQTTVSSVIYRAPTSNLSSWTAVGNLPGPVHSGQLYNDGTYLYLYGGRSGETSGDSTYLKTIYRAPVSNPVAWVDTGSVLPGKLAYSQLVVPGDGYLYLLGGGPAFNVWTNVIYRAPVSNPLNWSQVGTLPVTLSTSHATIIGNYIYLFGGRDSAGNYVNTIWRAPVSNPLSWTNTGATIPLKLGFSSLIQIGDYVYLIGGYDGSSIQNVFRAPLSNPLVWTNWTAQLPAGFDSSSPQIIGNYLYLMSGGQDSSWATQYVYRGTIQ